MSLKTFLSLFSISTLMHCNCTLSDSKNVRRHKLGSMRPGINSHGTELELVGAIVILNKNIENNLVVAESKSRDGVRNVCREDVIKNCYEATYLTYVDICRSRFECHSKFKSRFKKKSKSGCRKRFHSTRLGQYVKKNSTACQLSGFRISKGGRYDKGKSLENDNFLDGFSNAIFRRDRRCEDLFRGICDGAIQYATNETCYRYQCSQKLYRAFLDTGSDKCQRVYRWYDERIVD